jgi:hypothetical protein
MRTFPSRAAISMALILTACGPPPAEVENARSAEERARAWLALIDAGDYGDSWDAAAQTFQALTPKAHWSIIAGRVQGDLGEPMGRELVAARYSATLPWEAPGEHVFIQYRIRYGGRLATESLTMRREDEGWKTSGYRIRLE